MFLLRFKTGYLNEIVSPIPISKVNKHVQRTARDVNLLLRKKLTRRKWRCFAKVSSSKNNACNEKFVYLSRLNSFIIRI